MQRVTFRVPDEIHARARELARERGLSLNALLVQIVADGISERGDEAAAVGSGHSKPTSRVSAPAVATAARSVQVKPDPRVK